MMGRRNCDGLRLTHLPTGASVTVWGEWFHPRRRVANHPAMMARAKSWLLAKLKADPAPDRPVRNYHLMPGFLVRISQGGRVLADGPEVFDVVREGKGLDRVMAESRR